MHWKSVKTGQHKGKAMAQYYHVEIAEISLKSITVHAKNGDEALSEAEKMWKEGSVILDSSDFKEVEFNLKEGD